MGLDQGRLFFGIFIVNVPEFEGLIIGRRDQDISSGGKFYVVYLALR